MCSLAGARVLIGASRAAGPERHLYVWAGDQGVAQVTRDALVLDPRFRLDFDTAFATGPARPHGVAVK